MNGGAVFLDTSALYAVFDADDACHARAARVWRDLLDSDASLHTSSYVLVELEALLQRRLGVDSVDALSTYVLPFVNVSWVDERVHALASAALLNARRWDLSLVDHVSFVIMRALGVRSAFALNQHFAEQGFEVLPGSGQVFRRRAGQHAAVGEVTGAVDSEAGLLEHVGGGDAHDPSSDDGDIRSPATAGR